MAKTTYHLFNTYTSLNGTSAETLSMYNSLVSASDLDKDSVIFDTKRKSIWAKGVEYGFSSASNIVSDINIVWQNDASAPKDKAINKIFINGSDIAYSYTSMPSLSVTGTKDSANVVSNIVLTNNNGAYSLAISYSTINAPSISGVNIKNLTISGTKGSNNNISNLTLGYSGGAYTLTVGYSMLPVSAITYSGTKGSNNYVSDVKIAYSNASYSFTVSYNTLPVSAITYSGTKGSNNYVSDVKIAYSNGSYSFTVSYGTLPSSGSISSVTGTDTGTYMISGPVVTGMSYNSSNGVFSYTYSYICPKRVLVTTAATNNVTLTWNSHVDFSSALTSSNTVNFTFPSTSGIDGRVETMINFATGASIPTVNFPSSNFIWENNDSLELVTNGVYEISISYDTSTGKYTGIWCVYGADRSGGIGSGGGNDPLSLTVSGVNSNTDLISGYFITGIAFSSGNLTYTYSYISPRYKKVTPAATTNVTLNWGEQTDFTAALTSSNTVNFTLPSTSGIDGRVESMINFATGATVPTFSWSSNDIIWESATEIELLANAVYDVSISYDSATGKYTGVWGIFGVMPSGSGGGSQPSGGSLTLSGGAAVTGQYVSGLSLSGNTLTVQRANLPTGTGGGGDSYTFSNLLSSSGNTRIATVTYTGGSVNIYAPSGGGTEHSYALVVGAASSTSHATTSTSASTYINLVQDGTSVISKIWVKNGTNTTVQSSNTGYLQINSSGDGGTTTNNYYSASIVTANTASATSNATTYTTGNEAYLNIVYDGNVDSWAKLKGCDGITIQARGGTTYISGGGGGSVSTSGSSSTNGQYYISNINANNSTTITYNYSTLPVINAIGSTGSQIAYFKNAGSSTYTYIYAPSGGGGYINITESAGSYTFSIQSTAGTSAKRFVTHGTESNAIYNIVVGTGTDSHTLYIVV